MADNVLQSTDNECGMLDAEVGWSERKTDIEHETPSILFDIFRLLITCQYERWSTIRHPSARHILEPFSCVEAFQTFISSEYFRREMKNHRCMNLVVCHSSSRRRYF